MTTNERLEQVRQKLTDALRCVHIELAKCQAGENSVDSTDTLVWMSEGLEKMLTNLGQNVWIKPLGFWHIISDGWPDHDKLGDKIVDAEYSYDRLRVEVIRDKDTIGRKSSADE